MKRETPITKIPDLVQKRNLGNTGLEVSEIAFGGVEIGLPYGIGIKSQEDMLVEKEAIRLLHEALDKGINFYDTARMYGLSEKLMGKAFKSKRKEIILCSKCRHFRRATGELPGGLELSKIIIESLEESLEALQTDYLDLFMLHQADQEILENEEIAHLFTQLKHSGKVRTIGVSTYLFEETDLAIRKGIWEVIQLPFNLLDQRQSSLFEKAATNGIGLVIRSVLLKGLLSDRGRGLPAPLEKVEQHILRIQEDLAPLNMPLPAIAIKFALSFDQISSVLVGIDKKQYLTDALKSGDGNYLDKHWLATAQALAFPDPGFINLPLWDKKGWLV